VEIASSREDFPRAEMGPLATCAKRLGVRQSPAAVVRVALSSSQGYGHSEAQHNGRAAGDCRTPRRFAQVAAALRSAVSRNCIPPGYRTPGVIEFWLRSRLQIGDTAD